MICRKSAAPSPNAKVCSADLIFIRRAHGVDTLKADPPSGRDLFANDGQLVAWKQLTEVHKLLDAENATSNPASCLSGTRGKKNVDARITHGLRPRGVNRELTFAAEVRNYGSKPAESVRIIPLRRRPEPLPTSRRSR